MERRYRLRVSKKISKKSKKDYQKKKNKKKKSKKDYKKDGKKDGMGWGWDSDDEVSGTIRLIQKYEVEEDKEDDSMQHGHDGSLPTLLKGHVKGIYDDDVLKVRLDVFSANPEEAGEDVTSDPMMSLGTYKKAFWGGFFQPGLYVGLNLKE